MRSCSASFAASGISTGIAAIALILALGRRRGAGWEPREGLLHRLERADLIAIAVELLLILALVAWLASLNVAGPLISGGIGLALWIGVVLLGLLVPLALYLRPRLLGAMTPVVASVLALVGGFVLRWAILMAAQA